MAEGLFVVLVIHLCLMCPIVLGLLACTPLWAELFAQSRKEQKKHGLTVVIEESNLCASLLVVSVAIFALVLLLKLLLLSLMIGLVEFSFNSHIQISELSQGISQSVAHTWHAKIDLLISGMYRVGESCLHIHDCKVVEQNAYNMTILATQFWIGSFLKLMTSLFCALPSVAVTGIFLYLAHKKSIKKPVKKAPRTKAKPKTEKVDSKNSPPEKQEKKDKASE